MLTNHSSYRNLAAVCACFSGFCAAVTSSTAQEPTSDTEISFPVTDTVRVLRSLDVPTEYPAVWADYMGLPVASGDHPSRTDAANLIGQILQADDTSELTGARSAIDTFISSGADSALKACALYSYYNKRVALDASLASAEDFSASLPAWETFTDFIPKFILHYGYMDQAWQCKAEGNLAMASDYAVKVRETALHLFDEHSQDPNQIWGVYNYMFAASMLGAEVMEAAVLQLKTIVESQAPSILTWSARYQIGLFSSLLPGLPDEHRAQYPQMVEELDAPFFQEALSDPTATRDALGMIELMKGHALFGTHQYSAAEEQYKRVLANYADRLEWSPRASGRAIVNPSNYGVSNSAAYSLANCTRILHALEPNRGADMYERFLQTYPNSEYAGTAAIDLAGIYTELGDTARAETILTSVIADAVDGAVRQRAEDLSSPAGWRDTEAVLARACGAALETRRASARKDSPMTKEKRPSRLAGKYSMHPPN